MMLCHVYLYFYGSLTSEGLTFNVSSLFEHRYCEYRLGDLSFIKENVGFEVINEIFHILNNELKRKKVLVDINIFRII